MSLVGVTRLFRHWLFREARNDARAGVDLGFRGMLWNPASDDEMTAKLDGLPSTAGD